MKHVRKIDFLEKPEMEWEELPRQLRALHAEWAEGELAMLPIRLLACLESQEAPLRKAAEEIGCGLIGTARAVRALQQLDLVECRAVPGSRPTVLLSLTAAGREIAADLRSLRHMPDPDQRGMDRSRAFLIALGNALALDGAAPQTAATSGGQETKSGGMPGLL